VDQEIQDTLLDFVPLARTASVEEDPTFGFRQLTEIAIKALSPGINDPGTAMLSLRALFQLFSFRVQHHPVTEFRDKDERIRIQVRTWSLEQLFIGTIHAIWDYGSADRSIRHELDAMLDQLRTTSPAVKAMRQRVKDAIKAAEVDWAAGVHYGAADRRLNRRSGIG